jgi:hypothetical protein
VPIDRFVNHRLRSFRVSRLDNSNAIVGISSSKQVAKAYARTTDGEREAMSPIKPVRKANEFRTFGRPNFTEKRCFARNG